MLNYEITPDYALMKFMGLMIAATFAVPYVLGRFLYGWHQNQPWTQKVTVQSWVSYWELGMEFVLFSMLLLAFAFIVLVMLSDIERVET